MRASVLKTLSGRSESKYTENRHYQLKSKPKWSFQACGQTNCHHPPSHMEHMSMNSEHHPLCNEERPMMSMGVRRQILLLDSTFYRKPQIWVLTPRVVPACVWRRALARSLCGVCMSCLSYAIEGHFLRLWTLWDYELWDFWLETFKSNA